MLKTPIEIQVGGRSVVNSDISQSVEIRPVEDRFLRLLEILGEWYEKGKVLVFVSSQEQCDNLFRDLLKVSPSCGDPPTPRICHKASSARCREGLGNSLALPITGSLHLVSPDLVKGVSAWVLSGWRQKHELFRAQALYRLCCAAGGLSLPVTAWRQGPERPRVHHQRLQDGRLQPAHCHGRGCPRPGCQGAGPGRQL